MTELRTVCAVAVLVAGVACGGRQPPGLVRLYVLDGGTLHVTDPSRFQLKKDEVAELNFSVGCYLVTHPRGVLLWDTCAIPDSEWTYAGSPVKHHLVLPDKQERDFTLVKPLTMQLADAGHSPATITHLALSHYHYDHTANANLFPKAAWLVTDVEREAMFAVPPPSVRRALQPMRGFARAALSGSRATTTTYSAMGPWSSRLPEGTRKDTRSCT